MEPEHCCCCLSTEQQAPAQPADSSTSSPQDRQGANKRAVAKKQAASSWNAKRAGADAGVHSDFLSNLGEGQEYNINVDHGKQRGLVLPIMLFLL